jgi:hypothetical protein
VKEKEKIFTIQTLIELFNKKRKQLPPDIPPPPQKQMAINYEYFRQVFERAKGNQNI